MGMIRHIDAPSLLGKRDTISTSLKALPDVEIVEIVKVALQDRASSSVGRWNVSDLGQFAPRTEPLVSNEAAVAWD
jgi:hypothetical protein